MVVYRKESTLEVYETLGYAVVWKHGLDLLTCGERKRYAWLRLIWGNLYVCVYEPPFPREDLAWAHLTVNHHSRQSVSRIWRTNIEALVGLRWSVAQLELLTRRIPNSLYMILQTLKSIPRKQRRSSRYHGTQICTLIGSQRQEVSRILDTRALRLAHRQRNREYRVLQR